MLCPPHLMYVYLTWTSAMLLWRLFLYFNTEEPTKGIYFKLNWMWNSGNIPNPILVVCIGPRSNLVKKLFIFAFSCLHRIKLILFNVPVFLYFMRLFYETETDGIGICTVHWNQFMCTSTLIIFNQCHNQTFIHLGSIQVIYMMRLYMSFWP